MKPIKFDVHSDKGIFSYHFFPKEEERVINNEEYFFNNKRLWGSWCQGNKVPESYAKFNITSSSIGENILLYMLFIWELSKGKKLLGIGTWETELIQQLLEQEPKLVNWEYRLEHENDAKNIYSRRNIGFKNAKSPIITQYSKPINNIPSDKTGIFELNSFCDLTKFNSVLFGDAFSLSNFYISPNPDSIVIELQNNVKQDLDTILANEDIFFGLLMGEDIGQYDYLLITSKVDLTERINQIIYKINGFAKDYVSDIVTLTTSKEMIELIERKVREYNLL